MADYLPTNTARIRVTQTGPRGTHKMVFRVDPASTVLLATDEVHSICELMTAFMVSATSWVSAEAAPLGSDVFLPIAWTAIVHPDGVEAVTNSNPYGLYLNFVGRTTAGSRTAFYLFNVAMSTMTANNRLTPAENVSIAPLLDAFNGSAGILCGIDQNAFIMKGYGNSGINDRVAKKSRSLA